MAAIEKEIDQEVQRVIDAALEGQPMSSDAEKDIDRLLSSVQRLAAVAECGNAGKLL